MENLKRYTDNDGLHIKIDKADLNIADTLDCGQCFRFAAHDDYFHGVALGRYLRLKQADDEIIFYDTTESDFDSMWEGYLGLDVDYASIKQSLLFDKTISEAIGFAGGIRILKQDRFEAIISFLISQNNNIPRIKGSVQKLCERFGTALPNGFFTFPTISELQSATKADLQGLSLGYRDEYILDCVRLIGSGELDLDLVQTADIATARQLLRTIKGVGPKVCECVLLFGFQRLEAFPIDTWIKKVLATYYQDGFPEQATCYAGIAQQYLFHYIRKGLQNSGE